MPPACRFVFPALWACWAIYWCVAALGVKAPERREPLASQLTHMGPLALAALLLFTHRLAPGILDRRFVPASAWVFWLGALLTALGLAFTVWARVRLGREWSGTVTVKRGHELVTAGPYALVRHPIYTGLLLAFVGSALANGRWRAVLAVLIAGLALWRKLRLEERWMTERFGEAYRAYRARVPALVPFLPRRHR